MSYYQVGILKTVEDVMDRILQLEEEIKALKLKQKVRFIIFGGTALLLYTNHRVTSDIDCYLLEQKTVRDIRRILESKGVNNSIEGIMEFPPPEDFIERSQEFYNSDYLEVRLASKEDLVLSKLFSTRGSERDERDLIESSILDQVDLDYVRERYQEYCTYRIGTGVNISRLDDILKAREFYKHQQKEKVSEEV